METYYEILGVARTASAGEIERAYKRWLSSCHSDHNQNATDAEKKKKEDEFKTFYPKKWEAFEVLKDSGTKRAYDAVIAELEAAEAAEAANAQNNSTPWSRSAPSPSQTFSTSQSPPPPQPPSPQRVPWQPPSWFVGSVIASAICATLILLASISYLTTHGGGNDAEAPTSVSTASSQVQTPAVSFPINPPRPITARLDPLLYSYSRKSWGNYDSISSGAFPNVSGIGFHNNLGWGTGLQWHGSYSTTVQAVTLGIEGLRLPDELGKMMIRQWSQGDLWEDIGLGYCVELHGAVFDDYEIVKSVLLLRTFLGDSPPPRIEKTLGIIPLGGARASVPDIKGEWRGSFESDGRTVPFVMRVASGSDQLDGACIEFDGADRRRSTLRGFGIDSRITFLKRYASNPYGVSYVATEVSPHSLKGKWYAALQSGDWRAAWTRNFEDSVDDLPTQLPLAEGEGAPASRDESRRVQRAEGSDSNSAPDDQDQ